MQKKTPDEKGTREKIFDAAVELFSRKGYDGVSIREIANLVGIKESSLYNHYKSKDEILDIIFDYMQEVIKHSRPSDEELERMLASMPPEAVFRAYIANFGKAKNPIVDKIARIIYMEQYRNARARNFVLQSFLEEPAAFQAKMLRRMMERKLIREIDADLVAAEFNYGLISITIEYSHYLNEGLDPAPVVKKMMQHVDFFFSRLKV